MQNNFQNGEEPQENLEISRKNNSLKENSVAQRTFLGPIPMKENRPPENRGCVNITESSETVQTYDSAVMAEPKRKGAKKGEKD